MKRHDPGLDPQAGTSLVELVFASLVVLIVVGAVLSMAVRQSMQRNTNVESSVALAAAVDTLERARSLSETELVALDGNGFDVPGSNGAAGGLKPQRGDADGLPGEIAVAVEENTGGVRLHRVTVTVRWTGVTRNRELQIAALVGERKR